MSKIVETVGAAREYTEKILGGSVLEFDSVPIVGTTLTTLAKNNGDRVGLIIANLGTGTIYLAPDPRVATTFGIPITSQGSAVLLLTVDFTLVSREWVAVSDVNGPYNVFVLEFVKHTRG